MFTRLALITAAAAALLVAFAGTASAKPTAELIDRAVFDAMPERTDSTFRVDGATAGPLGGFMDLTVKAKDGTLPTTPGMCEPVLVKQVLTVEPGKVITVRTRGEGCAHIVDGSLSVNAGFRAKNVDYQGFGRCKPRLIGEGFIAAADSMIGGQGSFSAMFRR